MAAAGSGRGDEGGRWWDPLGMWSAAVPPWAGLAADTAVPAWARTPLLTVVETVRATLVGRRVDLGARAKGLAFTLTSVEGKAGPMAAAAGQLDELRVAAEDVTWMTWRLASVRAQLRNVHTRYRPRPVVVSAPVDLTVVVGAAQAVQLVSDLDPRLRAELTGEAVRLRWARLPALGWLEVAVAAEHGSVLIRPTALGRRRRRSLPGRWPAARPRLPLPASARVTAVSVRHQEVELQLRFDELRLDHRELLDAVRSTR